MANLSKQTKLMSGIVHLADMDYLEIGEVGDKLKKFLSMECVWYCFILHGMDIEEDGKTFKIPHIHFVFMLKARIRIVTAMNRLAESIGVSTLAVTMSKCNSECGAIQYLIHKNDPQKYQYPRQYIITNLKQDELTAYLESDDKGSLDFDTLKRVIDESNSMTEVYSRIGLSYAVHYSQIIKVMWNERFLEFSKRDHKKASKEA